MRINEVHGLVKRYSDHTAVNGIGFAVKQGKILGLDAGASPTIPRCPSRPLPAQAEPTERAVL